MKDKLKQFWWVPVAISIVSYLGLGTYFEGLRPVLFFQMKAHADSVYEKIAQNKADVKTVACIQIVAGFIQAKQENNVVMIAHWMQQAEEFGCKLPNI